ncbi:MAG: hypothetical protein K0R08_51 [Solimicrobium sp.]|jgi:hypothetical protein|nr:hypothetical protein [Solimicrobium sp.]
MKPMALRPFKNEDLFEEQQQKALSRHTKRIFERIRRIVCICCSVIPLMSGKLIVLSSKGYVFIHAVSLPITNAKIILR